MKFIYLLSIFSFAIVKDAYAYLDPGTGSLIIQGIIAGSLSVALFAKTYWYKLVSFFKKDIPEEEEEE
jgi:hypothetical protein